jgi:hypothetical protein
MSELVIVAAGGMFLFFLLAFGFISMIDWVIALIKARIANA